MENLILSVNVVLPLFLLMAAGYFCRQIKLYDMKSHTVMNKLVFKVFLPCLLFKNIYQTSLDSAFDWRVFVFAAVSIVVMFAALFLIVPTFEKSNQRRGALIQGIGRSNFVLFGIPLAEQIANGGNMAVASLLVAVVVPMFNILAVVTLEVFRGGKVHFGKVLKGIATNPLILSSLLGIVFLFTGWKLPRVIETPLFDLSKIATPLALFLLGGSLEFSRVGRNLRALLWSVSGRLVFVPLVFVSAAIALGIRGIALVSLMIVFAAPTAVTSYTMAQQMGADDELAGQQVVFTTAFSVLTIFLWVFALKSLGLI